MMHSDSDNLTPAKFKTVTNIQERLEGSAFINITVAHEITFCLPWFGDRLTVTRTRPVIDHLAKLGFGV